VADPNDNLNARYVELYNPTDSTIDLAAGQWSLVRYLATASATKQSVSLTGSIPAGGTYVVARSESNFTSTYSQSPDQSNGNINGDGDDAYALFFGGNNITGTLVDLYGDIGDGSGGIDGTGETWEYEDGRALRNSDVTSPNGTFTASEWTIYNDSASLNGTAEVADMTPGVHPDPSAADPVADYLTVRSLTSDDVGTDTNGNGFTVLEEYLAGFGDSSGSDVISYGIDNDGTLALTLTSDLELEPVGIGVVLEATSDLGVAFAPVAFTISVVDNNGSFTRSYTETTPPASEQRFLRLSITEE